MEHVAGLEHRRVDAAQQVLGAQRLAAVRERDDDAVARADERVQLVLGLRQAARGECGPLRLERERLARRKLVELGRAAQVDRSELLLLPHLAHLVRLPDEVGAARQRRDEVAGRVGSSSSSASVGSTRSRRRSTAG